MELIGIFGRFIICIFVSFSGIMELISIFGRFIICIFVSFSGIMELIGIFVGHLYFFLMFKYPQDFGGRRFLTTPSIL